MRDVADKLRDDLYGYDILNKVGESQEVSIVRREKSDAMKQQRKGEDKTTHMSVTVESICGMAVLPFMISVLELSSRTLHIIPFLNLGTFPFVPIHLSWNLRA